MSFWIGRKAAFPACGAMAPDYYCMDGSIPRGKLAEALKEINKLSKKDLKIELILNEKLIIKYLKNTLNNNDILLIKGSNSSLTNKISKILLKKGEN